MKSYNIQPVLNILRKLINSQETDVGLYRRNSENIFENYNSTSALKLSYELELILFLCYPFPKDVLYSKVLSILSEIGKLIQYIDDKNDEFDNFSTLIHNKEEYFSLRQSLPIVLSIELENMPIEYLFKKISKNEALYIHKNFIMKESIENEIIKIINNQIKTIEHKISELDFGDKKPLTALFNSITSNLYWNKNKSNEITL